MSVELAAGWMTVCCVGLAIVVVAASSMIYAMLRDRDLSPVALPAVFAGVAIILLAAFPAIRQEKQHHKAEAQECVDAGGVPYGNNRSDDQVCLYKESAP